MVTWFKTYKLWWKKKAVKWYLLIKAHSQMDSFFYSFTSEGKNLFLWHNISHFFPVNGDHYYLHLYSLDKDWYLQFIIFSGPGGHKLHFIICWHVGQLYNYINQPRFENNYIELKNAKIDIPDNKEDKKSEIKSIWEPILGV